MSRPLKHNDRIAVRISSKERQDVAQQAIQIGSSEGEGIRIIFRYALSLLKRRDPKTLNKLAERFGDE